MQSTELKYTKLFGEGRAPGGAVDEAVERHGEYLHLQVDAVEQRSRNAVEILLHGSGGAGALFGGMVVVATRAGVHAGYEHEAGGIVDGVFRPCHGDMAVFERLTHHLEHLA